MSDAINPDHYKRLPAEAIEIIEAAIEGAPTSQEAYLQGQALKYLLRANHKNGREDIHKAKWYLDRMVASFTVPSDLLDHPSWAYEIDPAEQPKAPLNSDKIPEGYRKLKDSSIEPRQVGDLRWSVAEKRYVAIVLDHLPYANRDNWAACRKVEPVIKQSSNTEPPDGWRWLEVGEVIRKGDKPVKGDAIPLLWIGTPCCGKEFILRRNHFEVGEKVVHIPSKDILQVIAVAAYVSVVDVRGSVSHYPPELLAPYFEDAK